MLAPLMFVLSGLSLALPSVVEPDASPPAEAHTGARLREPALFLMRDALEPGRQTPLRGAGDAAIVQTDGRGGLRLSEAAIRLALDVNDGSPVNVDAALLAPDGTIFLSFEQDLFVLGGRLLEDGGVAALPAATLRPGSGPDGAVECIQRGSAVVALTESAVLEIVGRAAPTSGDPPLRDVDFLALDPCGGSFPARDGRVAHRFPNLLLGFERAGELLVVSTAGGGRPAPAGPRPPALD